LIGAFSMFKQWGTEPQINVIFTADMAIFDPGSRWVIYFMSIQERRE